MKKLVLAFLLAFFMFNLVFAQEEAVSPPALKEKSINFVEKNFIQVWITISILIVSLASYILLISQAKNYQRIVKIGMITATLYLLCIIPIFLVFLFSSGWGGLGIIVYFGIPAIFFLFLSIIIFAIKFWRNWRFWLIAVLAILLIPLLGIFSQILE